ncbi:MAG: hypothetical protein LBV72_00690 [Tannerella sp.]|jgi:hypothetical protein|nr:hypothetical protein [Tannerella sp.]
MTIKSTIKQQAMKKAMQIWELKNGESIDPLFAYLIDVLCELSYENRNCIEDIRERLLNHIASVLTPDHLSASKPASTILRVMPTEPTIEIDKHTIFYTEALPTSILNSGIKAINFAPVTDHIKLVRGEIKHLLCERNLYRIGMDGEKDLLTRANAFSQDLNRCLWIGLDLDEKVETLQDIHFYIDLANLSNRYELYDLLSLSSWSIDGKSMQIAPGINNPSHSTGKRPGRIFSHYDKLNMSDEEVMDKYKKQFLHIKSNIRIASLKKRPFPEELSLFFPSRVKELEPQYWIKVLLPANFKPEEVDEFQVHLNAFPVSNKNLQTQTFDNSRSITGIIPLKVNVGEYFFAVDKVEDSHKRQYSMLPYASPEQGGTYTIKKNGLERFSTRSLADMLEYLIDLMHSDIAVFHALKIDGMKQTFADMEQTIASVRNKITDSNARIPEIPTYLIIDGKEKDDYIYADYWTTNCESANNLNYGTRLKPMGSIPVENSSCIMLRTTRGGKSISKNEDRLNAYKYSMTSHDRLFSAADFENFCYMKYGDRIQQVSIRKGIACSNKSKQGLTRTVDICLVPLPGYRDVMHDPITLGELKIELEKRAPSIFNIRVIIEDSPVYQQSGKEQ